MVRVSYKGDNPGVYSLDDISAAEFGFKKFSYSSFLIFSFISVGLIVFSSEILPTWYDRSTNKEKERLISEEEVKEKKKKKQTESTVGPSDLVMTQVQSLVVDLPGTGEWLR